MIYIKEYKKFTLNPFKAYRRLRNKRTDRNNLHKWKFEWFSQDDIDNIKDIFMELEEKYHLELDETGDISNYINIKPNERRSRDNPQFFIQNIQRCLRFTIASNKDFLTTDLINDINNFKLRLKKFHFKVDNNEIYKRTEFCKVYYISFFILKDTTGDIGFWDVI